MSLRNRFEGINNRTGTMHGLNSTRPTVALTVQSMRAASPQQTGKVMKLQLSPFFAMLPSFLQKLILNLWFLSFLRPSWKPRYLVLLGSFLYKFRGEQDSQGPKGSPVPIDGVDVHLMTTHEDSVVTLCHSYLDGYPAVLCISTLRRNYYYACPSRSDALTWVNSIRDAQQEAVTRSMGHSPRESYPASWTYFDSVGASLVQSKDRIRRRMEQSSLRELEMISLTDTGQPPVGLYT